MPMVVDTTTGGRQYKVRDMSQADRGRTEIEHAEIKNPGLMNCRADFALLQLFKGAKIAVSIRLTSDAAVFIETLISLGAEVRCCSSSTSSTEDHVAAAIARDSAATFAWNNQTLQEYWWCIDTALAAGGGPDLVFDHGGDFTLLIHEGVKAEEIFKRTGQLPDPDLVSTSAFKFQIMLKLIRSSIESDPIKYSKMKKRLIVFSEEISIRIKMCLPTQSEPTTAVKFGNFYGYRLSLLDGLMEATDFKIEGKIAAVCGFDEIGRGCAAALKQAGARVVVVDKNPMNILRAFAAENQVVNLEDVVTEVDIYVTAAASGDRNPVITVSHMRKMKDNAILCNMGQFGTEIDMPGLENFPGVQRSIIKIRFDRWDFSDTNSGIIVLSEGRPLANVGCPTLAITSTFTDQVFAEAVQLFADGEPGGTGMISSTTAILETTDEWSIRILEDLDGIEATAAAGRAEIISLEGDENWVPEMEDMDSKLGMRSATIHQVSEEMRIMSGAVDDMIANVLGLN